MKEIEHFFITVIMVGLLLLNGCIKEDPQPRNIVRDLIEDMVAILKRTGRYTEGEHSCKVEVSTDWYDYPSGTPGYYQVPAERLESMSTLGLIETILENPRFPTYGIYIYQESMDHFSASVPGLLEELYSRDDAASALIGRYRDMYYTCFNNNYSTKLGKGVPKKFPHPESQLYFAFNEIQMLMAQYDILNKATKEEIDTLSVHIIRTYMLGIREDEFFSFRAGETSLWLAARIMERKGYKPFLDLMASSSFRYSSYSTRVYPLMLTTSNQVKFMLHFNNFINERLSLYSENHEEN